MNGVDTMDLSKFKIRCDYSGFQAIVTVALIIVLCISIFFGYVII